MIRKRYYFLGLGLISKIIVKKSSHLFSLIKNKLIEISTFFFFNNTILQWINNNIGLVWINTTVRLHLRTIARARLNKRSAELDLSISNQTKLFFKLFIFKAFGESDSLKSLRLDKN